MLLSRILSRASRSTSRAASFLSSPPQALHAPLVSAQCRALPYGSPGKVVPPNQFIFHATPFRQYGISSSSDTETDDEESKRKFCEWVESYLKEQGYKQKTRDVEGGYAVYVRDPDPGEQPINDEELKKGLDIFLDEKEKRRFTKGKTLLGFITKEGVPRPGEVGATQAVENDVTEANTAENGS